MTSYARGRTYQRQFARYSDRIADRFDSDPQSSDDTLLAIACAITECAITVVGPLFWMCLASLFLVAELAD
jgi:hypothetical protein